VAKITLAGFKTSASVRLTGSVVYLRLYYYGPPEAFSFTDGEVHAPSLEEHYFEVAGTLAGGVATFTSFLIQPTMDVLNVPALFVKGVLFDANRREGVTLFDDWEIPVSLGSTVTFDHLKTHNAQPRAARPYGNGLERGQVELMISETMDVGNPATTSALGRVKMATAPADAASPLAVGPNDYATTLRAALTRLDTAPAVASAPVAVGVNSLAVLNRPQVFNVKAYGAVGNGVADDTAAFSAALAAALAVRGSLYFPAGRYLLSGVGSEILLVNKSITVCGDGAGASILVVASSVGASTDVIRVAPPAAGSDQINTPAGRDNRGYVLRDFAIEKESGTPARHAIVFDTSATNQYLHGSSIERVHVFHLNSTGRSLYWNNADGAGSFRNMNGIFTSVVLKCDFHGGFLGDFIGDTNNFIGCMFRTVDDTNRSVDFSVVPGATTINFIGCNSYTRGGWRVRGGYQVNITGCILETPPSFAADGRPLLDLAGDLNPLRNPVVTGNQFNVINSNAADCVRVGDAVSPLVAMNSLIFPVGNYGIDVTEADTFLGEFNNYPLRPDATFATPLFSPGSVIDAGLHSLAANYAEPSPNLQSGYLGVTGVRWGMMIHGYTEPAPGHYQVGEVSYIRMAPGAADETVTLPHMDAAEFYGREVTVLKDSAGAGNVVVEVEDGGTINGAATRTLTAQYQSETYVLISGNKYGVKCAYP
jgi:hypothetical protein